MVTRARRLPLTRTNSSRPNRSWSSFNMAAFQVVAAATKVLLGTFSLSNTNIDETILRLVGLLSISSDQSAATEEQLGAFGLIIVSERAATAGAASIPGPVTDAADHWFAYKSFAQRFLFQSAIGVEPAYATPYLFDNRGKRIVTEGRRIAIMVENAHATHGLSINVQMRLLGMVRGTG